ncbi:MAG: flagellar biosynthetic protein FliR [Candidatus Margulisbacteria bacterium]|nr:flagellar biosynthetic protein FliR [Candidatus Margulisiibacteriota bacterium]
MIITMPQLVTFFLIFMRMTGLIITSPIFSDKRIISPVKVAIVFWTSILFIFMVPIPSELPNTSLTFSLALAIEFLLGSMVGFITNIILVAIEFSGNLMDTQAGLSVASTLDPSSGHTATIISLLMRFLGIILFLQLDGHHLLLTALYRSFEILPLATPVNMTQGSFYIASLGTTIFSAALQLAAPILLIVFLIDFCFGMLSRVAPQINVFQLGFQIKPIITVFIFMLISPSLVHSIFNLLEKSLETVLQLFVYLR